MTDQYFNLKHKLEQLGYTKNLPNDAVPLVDCILSDLMQTTKSLQHYMKLAKEALEQRDSIALEIEPYKLENAKLIKENNELHREIMVQKEEIIKISNENKRKLKINKDELSKKEEQINKLQHELRELSMRSLCSTTLSSRNKIKRKECGDIISQTCTSTEKKLNLEKDLIELKDIIQNLEEKNMCYQDEVMLLKSQLEHRENEIMRLTILSEGGRSINKDCSSTNNRVQILLKQIYEAECVNDLLKKEIDLGLQKQHEAMNRALTLADKNKTLEEELRKVEALALKVEDDCNKQLSELQKENALLLNKVKSSNQVDSSASSRSIQFAMDKANNEKAMLQKEISDLMELNKSLQDKILSLTLASKDLDPKIKITNDKLNSSSNCLNKEEIQTILHSERKAYEKYIANMQEKLSETISLFNQHNSKCSSAKNKCPHNTYNNEFVKDLQTKLCEAEQKLLMLKKDNDELKSKVIVQESYCKQNYKDIVDQLNAENAELTNENIQLSQQLSHHRNISRGNDRKDHNKKENDKLRDELNKLKNEIAILQRDKQEYKMRNKESLDVIEKLKRDLLLKQSDIEQLNEENSSFRMSQRTDQASADRLKEECKFLREQIKKMQNDVIKEKSMANQIKNIHIETERSSNEMQSEIIFLQKKLSMSKDTISTFEKKCKDSQAEIVALQLDKSNLIDNIKKVDQERDKLVLELDSKTETISVLEQKLKNQSIELRKLDEEINEYKKKLNYSRISEHKLMDNETQLRFLNGEIARLNRLNDNALIEIKQLQNSLADANGRLKLSKMENETAKKEVNEMKQQLQHYVTEIRRIEEMLSHKEAERSDMLEHFASLSVEANILENTNQSLESESASKSQQLQTFVSKIQHLEESLLHKDNIIEKQTARISELLCKISNLEREVTLVTEEKVILEQNVAHLKHMCSNMQSEQKSVSETDSDFKMYEIRLKRLSEAKLKLEEDKAKDKNALATTEKLLSNARHEIVELKLALQDATSETKALKDRIGQMTKIETEINERTMTRELELPLLFEETIHEVSNEEDDLSSRYREVRKRLSRSQFTHHGNTL